METYLDFQIGNTQNGTHRTYQTVQKLDKCIFEEKQCGKDMKEKKISQVSEIINNQTCIKNHVALHVVSCRFTLWCQRMVVIGYCKFPPSHSTCPEVKGSPKMKTLTNFHASKNNSDQMPVTYLMTVNCFTRCASVFTNWYTIKNAYNAENSHI